MVRSVLVVHMSDGQMHTHRQSTATFDKCDSSLRIEDSKGDIVAHYNRHQWERVTQEVTQ